MNSARYAVHSAQVRVHRVLRVRGGLREVFRYRYMAKAGGRVLVFRGGTVRRVRQGLRYGSDAEVG